MQTAAILERARLEQWTDEEIVERVLAGEVELFELIMRRYNQRLYRTARAILRNDTEAEDVIQDAYVRAYHLRQFEGRAQFSTWLTRIAVHECLARVHYKTRMLELEAMPDEEQDFALFEPKTGPEEAGSKLGNVWDPGAGNSQSPTCLPVRFRQGCGGTQHGRMRRSSRTFRGDGEDAAPSRAADAQERPLRARRNDVELGVRIPG